MANTRLSIIHKAQTPSPAGLPLTQGGEFLVCSCATCDLPLLVLSKLISFIFAL